MSPRLDATLIEMRLGRFGPGRTGGAAGGGIFDVRGVHGLARRKGHNPKAFDARPRARRRIEGPPVAGRKSGQSTVFIHGAVLWKFTRAVPGGLIVSHAER
jgi:hypothetical protein